MITDSDTAVELGQQAPEPTTTPDPAPASTPEPTPSLLSEDPTPADAVSSGAFPNDWRDQMSGGDEQLAQMLSRYRSPENVGKALKELRVRMSKQSSPTVPALSENPTEQEVTEYRQAFSIPEESSGYEVTLPEELQRDEELMGMFLDHAHKNNMTPTAVQAAVDWYSAHQITTEQDRNEYAHQHRNETEDLLRQEWGSDYRGNLNAVQQYLDNVLGEEAASELRSFRNERGALISNDAQFLKLLVQPAIDAMGANAVYAGDNASVAQSLEERKQELMALRLSDPRKYNSDAVQTEMQQIYSRLNRVKPTGG